MALATWPVSVPYAPIGGSLQIQRTSEPPLSSEMNAGTTRRRRRFTLRIGRASFTLKMDTAQLTAFQTFYNDTLGDGAARFIMPVYFGSVATNHNVAFAEPPAYVPMGHGYWRVGISLLVEDLTPDVPADIIPNAFTFTDQTNASLSTVYESNTITVAGIDDPAPITVTGGEYSKNGGGYTSAAGTVVSGDTVKVRGTSSSSVSTAVNVVLTIGGVSDTFTITTEAADTTPSAFSFTDQTGALVSTTYESNTITVAGINSPAAISVTGGEYSKNGGAYTSASGTVVNGNTVKVRGVSSSSAATAVNVVLTIGGVSDTFTITTAAGSPPVITSSATLTVAENTPFSFTPTANQDVTWSVVGGVDAAVFDIDADAVEATAFDYELPLDADANNVYEFTLRATSVATGLTTDQAVTLTVTDVAEGVDTTPDAFTFTDVTGAALSTVYESNTITVAGITAAATVSVTGGEYSKNGGAYTSSAGTVVSGDTVKVRHTSSASGATATNTVLTIGGVSDTYTTTTTSFSPASLFAAAEKGVWYDPSDFSTMWQDTAGTTPVTATTQSVARIDDKSGNACHLIQATSGKRPTLQQDGSGFYYLNFDGTDDSMGTSATVNLSATDELLICAGIYRALTAKTTSGVLCEFTATSSGNTGSFAIFTPDGSNEFLFRTKGSAGSDHQNNAVSGQTKRVVTLESEISADAAIARNNAASLTLTNVGTDKGTGNFQNATLFVGGRNNASTYFNGRLYGFILRGKNTVSSDRDATEAWMNGKIGAY